MCPPRYLYSAECRRIRDRTDRKLICDLSYHRRSGSNNVDFPAQSQPTISDINWTINQAAIIKARLSRARIANRTAAKDLDPRGLLDLTLELRDRAAFIATRTFELNRQRHRHGGREEEGRGRGCGVAQMHIPILSPLRDVFSVRSSSLSSSPPPPPSSSSSSSSLAPASSIARAEKYGLVV